MKAIITATRLLRHVVPRNDEGGVPRNDIRGLAMTKRGGELRNDITVLRTKVILTSVVRGSITKIK